LRAADSSPGAGATKAAPLTRLALSVVGLGGIAAAGWIAWNYYAIPGLRTLDPDSYLALAIFGFLAGIGAFFAPCAVSLFPAYVSYYLVLPGGNPASHNLSVAQSVRRGAACALGALTFFVAIGVVLSLVAAPIAPYLIRAKPFVTAAIVLLGVGLLLDWSPPTSWLKFTRPLRISGTPGGSPTRGLFVYGFGYGLASTGCTLPLYVSVIVLPLTSGQTGSAFVTFASFGAALALVMLVASIFVGLSQESLIRWLQGTTTWIKRACGVVLMLAGLYAGYYYVVAGM
jgi:cytochrome c biogenesis protein CcdA